MSFIMAYCGLRSGSAGALRGLAPPVTRWVRSFIPIASKLTIILTTQIG